MITFKNQNNKETIMPIFFKIKILTQHTHKIAERNEIVLLFV